MLVLVVAVIAVPLALYFAAKWVNQAVENDPPLTDGTGDRETAGNPAQYVTIASPDSAPETPMPVNY